ncbi:hypothetical protein BDZ85DRAFT_287453 [Elsinoe ampelina]|uniref:Ankyrin repeat-containing domain protein n=1 Tax=Elsinoe ampelina TaxID=302913 RepID=A0A6A6GKV8_9PEZI|nr:hypothetical protein BDZ85DRAFT_287453 [Elsinoe ampelina]
MAATTLPAATDAEYIALPDLPADHSAFITYLNSDGDTPVLQLLQPYKDYDNAMRKVFAQQPNHEAITRPSVVSLFRQPGEADKIRVKARDTSTETDSTKEQKSNGSPAVVPTLQQFRKNFSVFSESSLSEMDWSNVVCAGSAVYTDSKRSMREYYHEIVAPASDVDLFLYDLTEEQAVEKIKQIEKCVKDSILTETTTIRTKNAITIASQHPTRHVQIVLRIYKSISEILTGFDVDCSCAAYDGKDVYASPRAVGAYMTQVNTIDLTRRSPSYENRLSKYSKRGFEVFWPNLERDRVDPTIFERNFGRTIGLARLLVLEKLPSKGERDAYQDQRRRERGRPSINRGWDYSMRGNVKEQHEDEVPEWVDEEQESDYHTFTIPYGPRFGAKKIEKLLYAKDLLLNSEWNKPKDRETNLHRHPAFFGNVEDVITDCCGYCPEPLTSEDEEILAEESKNYVSGPISFMKDDPGRQAIGSFNPITDQDWTEMAHIGNTEQLCQAIVDHDLEHVQNWLKLEDSDPNRRDHTGRTPLQLAVSSSSNEIVQALIDADARMVARMADGKTALHLAAMLGKTEMVGMILRRSEQNEEEEEEKKDAQRKASISTPAKDLAEAAVELPETAGDLPEAGATDEPAVSTQAAKDAVSEEGDDEDDEAFEDDDEEDYDEDDSDDVGATSDGSYVRVRQKPTAADQTNVPEDDDTEEPDVYDVNVTSWDVPVSALHLAIANGHFHTVKLLVQEHGADLLLPVKLYNSYDKSARAAILPIVLAMCLDPAHAEKMVELLIELGASVAQADMDQVTAFHQAAAMDEGILRTILRTDASGSKRALRHLAIKGSDWRPSVQGPLQSTIEGNQPECAKIILDAGLEPNISADAFIETMKSKDWSDTDENKKFKKTVTQPIILAVERELPSLAVTLLDAGADVNTLTPGAWEKVLENSHYVYEPVGTLLDRVDKKIEKLQEWKDDEDEPQKPLPLKSDSSYTSGMTHGTYQYWRTLIEVKQERKSHKQRMKTYQDTMNDREQRKGVVEKQQAIDKLVKEFQSLRQKVVNMGGKTLKALYPDVEATDDYKPYKYTPPPLKPFEPNTSYSIRGLTDARKKAYDRLFQACWENDEVTTRNLTLVVFDEDQSPLQIAVTDGLSFSPFSIAVLRGHFKLAETILEIAQAQYTKDGENTTRTKYTLNREDSDEYYHSEDEDEDPDEVRIHSRLVNVSFTIDDIGAVQSQVKSKVSPTTMMQWPCPAQDYSELDLTGSSPNVALATVRDALSSLGLGDRPIEDVDDEEKYPNGKPGNLFQLAIHNNDQPLLTWLLDLAEKYTKITAKINDESSSLFVFPQTDFLRAIQLNRTTLTGLVVQRTGAGIPLDALVEKSGVEVQEKPKHYQGLSVYGKKRADWAAQAGGVTTYKPIDNSHPPLLEACRLGSLDLVEYFLSDTATRNYQEFAEKHSHDKRLQTLAEAQGGLQAALGGWLSARSHLALHCVIMGKRTPDSLKLLSYLINKLPEQLEARSRDGFTPLLVAFSLNRRDVIEILIKANADQTARDARGRNILHLAVEYFNGQDPEDSDELRKTLSLIDPRLISSLAIERSSHNPGSLTPFAAWLGSARSNFPHYASPSSKTRSDVEPHMINYLRTILSFTGGAELASVNGAGETPLHHCVRHGHDAFIPVLLDANPDFLWREDATGRTPFEVAEDEFLSEMFDNPPAIPGMDTYYYGRRETGILKEPAVCFVEKGDKRSQAKRVWDVVRQRAEEQGQGKRKLCSLAEANEVAKRLAGRERREEVVVAQRTTHSSSVAAAEAAEPTHRDQSSVVEIFQSWPLEVFMLGEGTQEMVAIWVVGRVVVVVVAIVVVVVEIAVDVVVAVVVVVETLVTVVVTGAMLAPEATVMEIAVGRKEVEMEMEVDLAVVVTVVGDTLVIVAVAILVAVLIKVAVEVLVIVAVEIKADVMVVVFIEVIVTVTGELATDAVGETACTILALVTTIRVDDILLVAVLVVRPLMLVTIDFDLCCRK